MHACSSVEDAIRDSSRVLDEDLPESRDTSEKSSPTTKGEPLQALVLSRLFSRQRNATQAHAYPATKHLNKVPNKQAKHRALHLTAV